MAFLAAALPAITAIATIGGTAMSALGTIAAGKSAQQAGMMRQAEAIAKGKAAQQAAEFQAKQLDAKGKEEFAASQVEAEELRRRKALALSEVQTKAAAGGFSATDPSTLAIADEIARYGTIQQQMAQFGGASRREGLEGQARGERYSGAEALRAGTAEGAFAAWEGKAKRKASYYDAGATILGGISSLAGKYDTGGSTRSTSYRYG